MPDSGENSILGGEGRTLQGPNVSTILYTGRSRCSNEDRQGEGGVTDFSQLIDMFFDHTSRHSSWTDLTLETEKFGMQITSSNVEETDTEFVRGHDRYYWRVVQPLQIRRHPEANFDEMVLGHGEDRSLEDAIRHMTEATAVHFCLTLSNIVDYISEHRAMQFLTNRVQFWGSGSESVENG